MRIWTSSAPNLSTPTIAESTQCLSFPPSLQVTKEASPQRGAFFSIFPLSQGPPLDLMVEFLLKLSEEA